MSSQVKTKKRTLPAWMTAAHNNVKQKNFKEDGDGDNRSSLQEASDKEQQKINNCESNTGDVKYHDDVGSKTVSDIILEAMPFVQFSGNVTYIYQTADCACVCEEIMFTLDAIDKIPVGFDMEWPVSYKQGSTDKTALIQMCFPTDKCYLFQVCDMNLFPKQLTRLICHENILLVGLNIESDLWKLERDFDIRVKPLLDRGSVVDIGKLANKKLKSCERWDLNGLCKNVLGKQLKKDHEIRCGNWTDIPLSQDQISYSANDAYAGLVLYQKLKELKV